jgi:hypothetical protein
VLIVVKRIKQIKALWKQVHDMHPAKYKGSHIIDSILQHSERLRLYIPPESFSFVSEPTTVHLLEDLKGHSNFHNVLNGRTESNPEFFSTGWAAMADHANPLRPNHTPYNALDVVTKSKTGLLGCVGSRLPRRLEKAEAVVWRDISSEITPGGNITPPHIDHCGSGEIILGVYGKILILMWEPTDKNLEIYQYLHAARNGDITANAIVVWEGLKWSVVGPGEYVVVEPGQIYAVVSPSNSATLGLQFVDLEMVLDGTAERMWEWELNLIQKRLVSPMPEHQDLKNMLALNEREMSLWRGCEAVESLDEPVKVAVQKFGKHFQDIMKDITHSKEYKAYEEGRV